MDCRKFLARRPYDEVISNLPFGIRVGSHLENQALYVAIADRLPQWLKPGGVAVLYTMEFTLLKRILQERPNLKLLKSGRTEAGGLTPGIFILRVD